MKKVLLLTALALIATPALAQNATSNSSRTQGTPSGSGDPVHIGCKYQAAPPTLTDGNHGDVQCDNTGAIKVSGSISSSGTATVTGNVASGSADSGNPVKTGCKFLTTPVAVTNAQRVDLNCDAYGDTTSVVVGPMQAPADSFTNVIYGYDRQAGPGNYRPFAVANWVWNGTNIVSQRGDINQTPVGPGLTATYWKYTSGTSPILSNTTTAVTIKTAAGAGIKNALDSCQIGSTALGAVVPLAIRDGAGGSVIFAVRGPTAGWLTPFQVTFNPPLVGTANTLMEIVTTTANTSGTYDVNCQGHTIQ